jgi:hypothetical protein
LVELGVRAEPIAVGDSRSAVSRLWTYLSPAQAALFQRMSASEQRHGLAVLEAIEKEGRAGATLGQAALLHDAGKTGAYLRLWHRVTTVVLHVLAPGALPRLACDEPGSWRYPFFIQYHHAERGAKMAGQAGSGAMVSALIHWHHTPPDQTDLDAYGRSLLAALRSADDNS